MITFVPTPKSQPPNCVIVESYKEQIKTVPLSMLMKKWAFRRNLEQKNVSDTATSSDLNRLMSNLNQSDNKPVISMAHGEPSVSPCFSPIQIAADAIAEAVHSAKFNGYSPTGGLLPARRAVADYLSMGLPDKLSPDDVFLTMGCKHAAQNILTALAGSNSNILFPKPSFPYYEVCAKSCHLEVRHYDLLPEKDWEVDLESVESVADENTVAMFIINPGNPCGNVFTHQHLKKIAETARKLGILVISDEVYDHLAFGKNPFVSMGVFGSIAPVITLGSLSKKWVVPGWRLGWLATHDPMGVLTQYRIIESIKGYFFISSNVPTFIQGALPDILGKREEGFFSKNVNIIREAANYCYKGIMDTPGVSCPSKPEGSIFIMVKLDLSVFKDIKDDVDFCIKLANEESVLIIPGISVGLKNWLRLTFAMDPSYLEDAIKRLKSFCRRHSKNTKIAECLLHHIS